MAGLFYISDRDENAEEPTVSVAEAMGGGSSEGYLRATAPREFEFPQDHGPHPGFKTEWWYYTGNVFTEDGRQFGYQFTIFRSQLSPPAVSTDSSNLRSNWSTDQLYLGHFAVSDVASQNHVFEERYSRGAVGLAGAQADPFRIWLEDWEVGRISTDEQDDRNFPVKLRAMSKEADLDLELKPVKPLVLQGEEGYDAKGPEPGNASYYLSFTRMETSGTITVDGRPYEVNGYSWMDHEWSTSALGKDQEGWDWFSIQLSNGTELMYYQLRNTDGSLSTFTTGSFIDREGDKIHLNPGEVELEVLDVWESPNSKGIYPSAWRLRIPAQDLNLNLRTLIPDQEMDVSVRYYEGTLAVSGEMKGEKVSGQGYIEMTGYGESQQ